MSIIHKCLPEKTVTIRPNDKPWMDSLLRKTIRIRNRLRKKAQKSCKDSDWYLFRKFRNKVNNMKKNAKENFYNNLEVTLSDLQYNYKRSFWKIIRQPVEL